MFVRSIHVGRVDDFGYGKIDPAKPFQATVTVEGQRGKVELLVSPDLSRRIVEIIAEQAVAAGRATAEAMTAEVMNITALPAPEAA